MGSCAACPAEYPWLPDQYDDIMMQTTSTPRETTSKTTQESPTPTQKATTPAPTVPITTSVTTATSGATDSGYHLVINVLLVIQGFILSFFHLFC